MGYFIIIKVGLKQVLGLIMALICLDILVETVNMIKFFFNSFCNPGAVLARITMIRSFTLY